MRRQRSIPVGLILILMIVFIGLLLWSNSQPAVPVMPIVIAPATEVVDNSWQTIFQQGFKEQSTALPTVGIPEASRVPDIIPTQVQLISEVAANDVQGVSDTNLAPVFATPTPIEFNPTPGPESGTMVVPPPVFNPDNDKWKPPALQPPLSRDPLGRDHYWFYRPIDSNANNAILSYYAYASNGPDDLSPLRVHHGVDISNPIGEVVRAAQSGKVVWAADGRENDTGIFQNSPSYGNVIVIEHDFGYQGKTLYTLYAHLSAALVVVDQYVEAGEAIGLVGNSGNVTGPHLHFEIRIENNNYSSTYNPILWMVPYVGHGVIAGRVVDFDGNLIDDADITIRSRSSGLQVASTESYVYQGTKYDINPDPLWQENFIVPDVLAGRYDVIVNLDGQLVIRTVDVQEGMTSFVELAPIDSITQGVNNDG
ncbi:hypothetical protein MASR2M15_14920 [Anaerolineales bacterium]